jgi:hypothetical protein
MGEDNIIINKKKVSKEEREKIEKEDGIVLIPLGNNEFVKSKKGTHPLSSDEVAVYDKGSMSEEDIVKAHKGIQELLKKEKSNG